jgi:hypothetical protein
MADGRGLLTTPGTGEVACTPTRIGESGPVLDIAAL